MKVDKNFICFGCGEKGTVIDFVSKLFNLKPYDAALKLIDDFGLTVTVQRTKRPAPVDQRSISREQQERSDLIKSVEQDEARISILEKIVMKLYEDMVAGRISNENFQSLLSKTQAEQKMLEQRVRNNRAKLHNDDSSEKGVQKWLDTIKEYSDIQILDSQTLHTLIKEIIVHENVEGPGNRYHTIRNITVEIHFNLKPTPELIKIQ